MKSVPITDQEAPEPSSGTLLFVRFVLVASLCLFLLVTTAEYYRQTQLTGATASATPGPKDSIIVPGLRIGYATLGTSIEPICSYLGAPKIEASDSGTIYKFPSHGMKCVVDKGTVTSVLTENPSFATKQNTRVGSPLQAALNEFGHEFETTKPEKPNPKAPAVYVMHYWKRGVHLSIADEKVRLIWVTPAIES